MLAEIARLAAEARGDPRLLARPVRVIVPSRSLRDHLARALVQGAGALAGLSIHTLYGLAVEVLDRSGVGVPSGEALFPLLVRRAAREEPMLRDRFDSLAQGYGVVEGVVADLLDAGFDASHEAPVQELLLELRDAGLPVEIAQAVVRSAVRTLQAMHELGVGHRSLVLRWARTLIEQDAAAALPSRAILVHGFADATGTASDLLAALVSHGQATVFLDAPAEPGEPTQASAPAARFSERLRSRLEGLMPILDAPSPASREDFPGCALELLAAPGASAELRAVALRVRSAIDGGTPPESIGVVARDPSDYALPIRVHFRRLGIPFSGVGVAGPGGRALRRAKALLALLRSGPDTELESWMDALGSACGLATEDVPRTKLLADLRLASKGLGLRRLGDLAAEEAPMAPFSLPLRLGLRAGRTGEEPFAPHAKLGARAMQRLIEVARETCDAWRAWQARADSLPVADPLADLRELLTSVLGWREEHADSSSEIERADVRVLEVLAALSEELPTGLQLSSDELCTLLEREFELAIEVPMGGLGGGVQILGVMEARSRCFDRLFVVGLNRDVFPRPVREDPLLPDALRQQLCILLPELPIKHRGYDEERHLFAQLLTASPRTTLSWQYTSDEGRERAPSTLVERLRWARPELVVEEVPALHTAPSANDSIERPAWEHGVAAGLHGTQPARRAALEAALRERAAWLSRERGRPVARSGAIVALADAKAAVLREMDRPAGSPPALGPYFGLVGPVRSPADLRNLAPFVTALEHSASCGWRFLLEKLLKLEVLPDPEATLPDVGAIDVGSLVHEVLEQIVEDARPKDPAPAGFAVPWPKRLRFEQLLGQAAAARLLAAGIDSRALTEVLCEFARPLLERARELDWPQGSLQVLDVECLGEVRIPGSGPAGEATTRLIRFVADRIDPPNGKGLGPLLTDYKTGAPISTAVKPATRRKHLLEAVRSGRQLQAVAYACGSPTAAAVGRYLQLAAENPETAAARVSQGDGEFVESFYASANALLGAWEGGGFAPQLAPPPGATPPCNFCSVSEACSRGDSGARKRLIEWERHAASAQDLPTRAERSLQEVIRMRRGESVATAKPGSA